MDGKGFADTLTGFLMAWPLDPEDTIQYRDALGPILKSALLEVGVGCKEGRPDPLVKHKEGMTRTIAKAQQVAFDSLGIPYELVEPEEYIRRCKELSPLGPNHSTTKPYPIMIHVRWWD